MYKQTAQIIPGPNVILRPNLTLGPHLILAPHLILGPNPFPVPDLIPGPRWVQISAPTQPDLRSTATGAQLPGTNRRS